MSLVLPEPQLVAGQTQRVPSGKRAICSKPQCTACGSEAPHTSRVGTQPAEFSLSPCAQGPSLMAWLTRPSPAWLFSCLESFWAEAALSRDRYTPPTFFKVSVLRLQEVHM